MENAWKCIGCLERFLLLDFLHHVGWYACVCRCFMVQVSIYQPSTHLIPIHCITGGWSSWQLGLLAVSKSLTVFASTANWPTPRILK